MLESDELREVATSLLKLATRAEDEAVLVPLDLLEQAASEAAKAWSGSSLGYHANVYYDGLQPPPPGAHFSQEWGLQGRFQGSTGTWREYPYDAVYQHILKTAAADLSAAEDLAAAASSAFSTARSTVDSILTVWMADRSTDTFLAKIKEQVEDLDFLTATRATELLLGSGQILTRDSTALGQGQRAAPHQAVIGRVVGCRSPLLACRKLADLADRAAAHLDREDRRQRREERKVAGSYVFLGHGRSLLWMELKGFVEERLGLRVDEFNRVPVAGVTNVERLVQMLDDAALALLVLTAEDEKVDGSVVARQNVVHEAGLFQGRLGFTRAIVVIEDGCEGFSNIEGLGEIRFPKGQIKAAFEEVRQVLERESLV